MMMLDV